MRDKKTRAYLLGIGAADPCETWRPLFVDAAEAAAAMTALGASPCIALVVLDARLWVWVGFVFGLSVWLTEK